MNLSILARASILSSTLTSRTLNRTIPHRPISSSSLSYTPTSPNPKTPLFLRPPIFTATLTDLKKFQTWAQTLASSVGSSFTESDNGPCSEILLRELNWLIQDSRIEERRPFQYVVGCEHWRDLVLSVEEGVLIPRPETELMVDLVEDVVKEKKGLKRGLWVDLGTGSGAIGIGIGRVLGDEGRVVAVDVSPVAVQVALFNVRRYNLEDKVSVKQGSWFEPLSGLEGQIAGLVSNPPYIPSGRISGLQAEVGRHEPILALDGGEDGMSDLLHLCNGAASMLKPGGFFAFETNGEDQCRFLVDHMESVHNNSFCDLKIVPDFAGVQRFVTGFRS
ncbi:putative peptide chain release factor N(5)-glutamine methyltransferase [Helianthus annuus]|nr:putative peptide chain release factor N(5)-glutamine methyltransferase [Helianthus annuus]